jgi:hypothetical protein
MHKAAALAWAESGDWAIGSEYLRSVEWPLDAKHTQALALQCWGAYAAQAKLFPLQRGDHNNWNIVALEQRVVLPVEYSDVRLSFQLDRLLQCQDTEALALVDIKTASKCDSRWIQQWPRDLQMRLYSEAIRRHYGRAPEYIIIEGINKSNASYCYVPLPEFSQSERDEAWRQFLWIAHHDAQLLDACTVTDYDGKGHKTQVVDAQRLVAQALTNTPQNRGECNAYGRPCPFMQLCDSPPDERVGMLAGDYVYVEPEYV